MTEPADSPNPTPGYQAICVPWAQGPCGDHDHVPGHPLAVERHHPWCASWWVNRNREFPCDCYRAVAEAVERRRPITVYGVVYVPANKSSASSAEPLSTGTNESSDGHD
jgi:hypothetical protein